MEKMVDRHYSNNSNKDKLNENIYVQTVCMQTNIFNMLLVWSKVFVLFVELFPSTGVLLLWVIGVRSHANCLQISIL